MLTLAYFTLAMAASLLFSEQPEPLSDFAVTIPLPVMILMEFSFWLALLPPSSPCSNAPLSYE